MAENGSGGGVVVREEKAAAPPRSGGPARPTITLPPRSFESLFRGGGGSASGVSPGPLTLVSSFFAEDPESDCRSFTQLLVGAMNSPVGPAAAAWKAVGSAGEEGKEAEERSDGGGEAESGGGLVRLGQKRPPCLAISQPQMFTLPPGLSPGSLLDSPAFFSPALGKFTMSHQEALAQVTAHAAQSPFRMLSQAEFPAPCSTATTDPSSQLIQEVPTLEPTAVQSAETSQSDQVSPPNTTIVDKPTHDGYNWRKYGQKVVKGSDYPRSYYKCTHPKCTVKKKVEHSVEGQVTEIIYKGQHNHERPVPSKRIKEVNGLPSESNGTNGKIDNLEPGSHGCHGNLSKHNNITGAPISRRDQEPDHRTPEQFSGSSDSEELTQTRTHWGDANERDPKRRNIAASSQKTLTEPRIIVQTTSEVDLLDDGYRWRKYGQKVVKGNAHPRSYYKCTYAGCNVRKHIERSPTDPTTVITSYEGKHNHDIPAARSSSHSSATASNSTNCNPASLASTNIRNYDRTAVAADPQLKEEYDNTVVFGVC